MDGNRRTSVLLPQARIENKLWETCKTSCWRPRSELPGHAPLGYIRFTLLFFFQTGTEQCVSPRQPTDRQKMPTYDVHLAAGTRHVGVACFLQISLIALVSWFLEICECEYSNFRNSAFLWHSDRNCLIRGNLGYSLSDPRFREEGCCRGGFSEKVRSLDMFLFFGSYQGPVLTNQCDAPTSEFSLKGANSWEWVPSLRLKRQGKSSFSSVLFWLPTRWCR